MKVITDELRLIATTLGVDFIRGVSLTETDIQNHARKSTNNLMAYVGASSVTNEFEGAEIIDIVSCEIYFLVKSPSKDMSGDQLDDTMAIAKRMVDQTYASLNSTFVVKDIEPYTLEGVGVLTDMFVGYLATIGIPVYNTGC